MEVENLGPSEVVGFVLIEIETLRLLEVDSLLRRNDHTCLIASREHVVVMLEKDLVFGMFRSFRYSCQGRHK